MKLGNWIAALGGIGLGGGVLVMGLAGQGCSVTLSNGCDGGCGFTGEDSSVPDAGPVNPCHSCLYGQCVGQVWNCFDNASCLGIHQCATSDVCAADGGNCVQNCYDKGTPLGKFLYLALGTCDQAAECTNIAPAAACATTCSPSPAACATYPVDAGPGPDSAPPDEAGADAAPDAGPGAPDAAPLSCSACTAASCSAQVAACAVGTTCERYQQCLSGCASQTCNDGCANGNPTGFAAATALGTCTSSSCPQCFQ